MPSPVDEFEEEEGEGEGEVGGVGRIGTSLGG
jgi:hypothetical protein